MIKKAWPAGFLISILYAMPCALADVPLRAGLWSETRMTDGQTVATTKFCKTDKDVSELKSLLKGNAMRSMNVAGCHIANYSESGNKISFEMVCRNAISGQSSTKNVKAAKSAETSVKATGSVGDSSYDIQFGKVRFIGKRVGDCE